MRQVNIPLAPESALWAEWIRPYEGMNWLEIPWFFAEEYFYLRILEATGYFQEGPWQGRDPYAGQKRLGLETSRAAIRQLGDHVEQALRAPVEGDLDTLARLLLADLWGNQNDLSMWPVNKGQEPEPPVHSNGSGSSPTAQTAADERILSNDLPALLAYFGRLDPSRTRVDLLLDNAGYELVADLALADFLLTDHRAAQVVLHTKSYPVFVSDALDKDIHDTLDFLAFDPQPAVRDMAVRLRTNLVRRSLVLRSHPFWTSPLAAWDMPAGLVEDLRASNLLISKGDANYRRLLGDRHWPIDLPFNQVVNYFPCPLLALRTLKSEIAVGLDPHHLPTADPEWMINGRWGLVQFASRI